VRAFTFFDLAFLGGVSINLPDCDPGMAAGGGGSNFECLNAGVDFTSGIPVSGVGFAAGMQVGNSPFFFTYGDTFDSYAVGETGTLSADESFDTGEGTAWSGDWITMDSHDILVDDYDSYTVEDPLVQTMNSGTGFSAAWEYGTMPILIDDYDSYTVEDPLVQSMNSGTGFSAAWEYGSLTQYMEDFDSYTVEDPLTASLNSGTGFSAAWIYSTLTQYKEDFDSYAVEDPLTASLNSGTGFSAAWIYGTL
jgi:hypothetical protein